MNLSVQYLTIFLIFLKLGFTSFGGPAAHLVFFHRTFVEKYRWLTSDEYTQLVALAQLLPGPTSSQVGLGIGYLQRGYGGALLAWLGFTLPSIILMLGCALLSVSLSSWLSSSVFHTVQLIVLAVVIFAFWQMLKNFCSTVWQFILMLASALIIYFIPLAMSQLLVIILGGVAGLYCVHTAKLTAPIVVKDQSEIQKNVSTPFRAYYWLLIFVGLFILLFSMQQWAPSFAIQIFESFYRSGSLVFGGGHVVLSLLYQELVTSRLIEESNFELGYAFAQLVPGPLFTFASYLGAFLPVTSYPLINAAITTVAIFLPSFLLIFGTLPYWSILLRQTKIQAAVYGINAAVVGLLLAMVVQLGQKGIQHWSDIIFVGLVIALLNSKIPVLLSLPLSCLGYFLFSLYF
ncbi:chromate efflux transporter [Acinetobacter radioresistens]|uniref:chromate efflux transporter n=1 Tax=Acinetobacter radioresistens TaxID=40216 RepID=UPI0020050609|nr:chromate efflux transporter [Acinetobacter radioresistens]MCK4109176.1 chromate efflux transporter [Acinetobacter radioresistens]